MADIFDEISGSEKGDIFDEVSAVTSTRTVGNPDASPAEIERGRRKFVDKEGTLGTQAREVVKSAGRTLKKAASNIPDSAATFVKNVATPIMHPVETLSGLASAAGGAVGEAMGSINPDWQAPPDESTAAFNNLKDTYKQRYGGLSNISETFATDPVGTVADVASLASLGRGAARKAGVLPEPAPRPAAKPRIGGEKVKALGEKYGIDTTLGEQIDNPRIVAAETLNEKIPFSGMSRYRNKVQQQAEDAAKTHFSQYVVDPSLDTTAAMKISNDAHLDDLYQAVRDNAQNIPKGAAPAVKQTTASMLDRFPSVFESIQDTKVKRVLQDIYGDVKNKTVQTGILDAQGNPISKRVTPEFSFDDLWELRKGIGKEIGDVRTETARGVLNGVYAAVSTDIDNMLARSGGTALNDFKAANNAFKQYSVKFDAMRAAYDKAAGTTGAGETFSPKKFSTALKSLANDPNYKKNVKWTPQEVQEMTGLANILQVVKRAGQFRENVPTGNRMADALGIAAIAKAPTLPVAWATTFLTTTKTGQSFLRKASSINPKSPAMGKLMLELYQIGKISNSTQEAAQ